MRTEAQKKLYNDRRKATRDRRIAWVIRETGDSVFANSLRDRNDDYIRQAIKIYFRRKGIKKKPDKERINELDHIIDEPIPEDETKNERNRRKYKEAREAGYTPQEAQKLRNKGKKNFEDIISFNRVVSSKSRSDRWASMGKREAYDPWIIEEAERVNKEAGLDANASFGWNAIYMYYTEGGTIEFWATYFQVDPLNPNIYRARQKTAVQFSTETRKRRLK